MTVVTQTLTSSFSSIMHPWSPSLPRTLLSRMAVKFVLKYVYILYFFVHSHSLISNLDFPNIPNTSAKPTQWSVLRNSHISPLAGVLCIHKPNTFLTSTSSVHWPYFQETNVHYKNKAVHQHTDAATCTQPWENVSFFKVMLVSLKATFHVHMLSPFLLFLKAKSSQPPTSQLPWSIIFYRWPSGCFSSICNFNNHRQIRLLKKPQS